jgi:uncharacterized protein with FMN-binding domain
MKYIKSLALALCVALAGAAFLLPACAGFKTEGQAAPEQADGIYEGIAQGYRGPIRVQVRIEAGTITEITIIDSAEDRSVGGIAMEELLELVLQYNTTDVDAISGATESSEAFLAAVENAILSQ